MLLENIQGVIDNKWALGRNESIVGISVAVDTTRQERKFIRSLADEARTLN